MKKLLALFVVSMMMLGLLAGAVGASDEYKDAPAIANELLREAGVKANSMPEGNYIRAVAHEMDDVTKDFWNIPKSDVDAYRAAVRCFLMQNGLMHDAWFTAIEYNGSFTSITGRHLPGEWSYDINIIETIDGCVWGAINLTDPYGVVVTAVVESVKQDYAYWYNMNHVSKPNLAAVGTATYGAYNGNFMFLFSDNFIWMALSSADYHEQWTSEGVWASRDYDILGGPGSYGFPE